MQHARIASLAAAALLGTAGTAGAQSRDGGPLGLGGIVGSPTGPTAKWRAAPTYSFDVAVGIGFGNAIHIHADWLYEGFALVKEDPVELTWFAGAGGRFAVRDDHDNGKGNDGDDDDEDDEDLDTGPRFPVGLEMKFSSVRQLELFAEVAVGIEVADDTGVFLDGGVGARWFF